MADLTGTDLHCTHMEMLDRLQPKKIKVQISSQGKKWIVQCSVDEERQSQDGGKEVYLMVRDTDCGPENLGPNPDCHFLAYSNINHNKSNS